MLCDHSQRHAEGEPRSNQSLILEKVINTVEEHQYFRKAIAKRGGLCRISNAETLCVNLRKGVRSGEGLTKIDVGSKCHIKLLWHGVSVPVFPFSLMPFSDSLIPT